MYLQQALRQHDAKEFVQAFVKEVNGHVDCKNSSLKKRSKVPRSYLLYGWCDANVTLQRTRSSPTRPDWSSTAESKSKEWTILRLTHLLWHGLQLDTWSFLVSSSVGHFAKLILLWLTHKLRPRWTSIWNFHKASRLHTGTPRITCWSWKITSAVKSKLVVSGTHWYGASLGEPLCDTHNPTLGLFSRTY